ncbi:Suv3p [Sugiyamaella lignohabitans]|uniref:Suv3p n=1 Tax=Sugiyamaella lignohabitans TaxID=796027 RepID=A0A167EDS7_9ASCO|nr:Suv3p [Sugiyamaella lignohabitans]ANB13946.1 Suv3p [Sugiyamaella lignohabitans]
MKSARIPCNLVTGEEVIEEFDETGRPAGLCSGTVEMMDINRQMDVAVLDEIQMIDDAERGWAWTQAFLAVQAREIHLCGDPNTEELVRKLAAQAGDELEVVNYTRLSPLEIEKRELGDDLQKLQPGDCLVFFSKRHILAAKNIIEAETGDKCAVIYGSLPAETRSKQAELFNDPDSDVKYLVASDAIGMGLNLAVRRIIFSRVRKFNGHELIKLPIAQVKQIAGRAGRFQTAPSKDSRDTRSTGNVGYVTSLHAHDREYIEQCLALPSPPVKQAAFFPSDTIIQEFAHFIGPQSPYHQMLARLEASIKLPPLYKFVDLSNMITTSKIFANIRGLLLEEMMTLAKAPVSSTDERVKSAFYSFCLVIANGQSKTITEIPNTGVGYLGMSVIPNARPSDTFESIHRVLSLYLWLSYRFPTHFLDRTGAMQLKELCETKINDLLKKSPSISRIVGRKKAKSFKATALHDDSEPLNHLQPPSPRRPRAPTRRYSSF